MPTYYALTATAVCMYEYNIHSYYYHGSSVWPRKITQATASFPPGMYKTQVTFGYIANPIWTPYPGRNLIKASQRSQIKKYKER